MKAFLCPFVSFSFLPMNIPYIRSGDYFIPDPKLPEATHPIRFQNLVLPGNLRTYLVDLNAQAKQRMNNITARADEHKVCALLNNSQGGGNTVYPRTMHFTSNEEKILIQ